MGKRRQGKTNNSIEDLVGNKENEYPVSDLNRMMINMTNELNDIHKKFLKKEIMNELIEILMEKIQEMVKQNVQDELKQNKDFTVKNLRRHGNN
jgi:hypothetical protein